MIVLSPEKEVIHLLIIQFTSRIKPPTVRWDGWEILWPSHWPSQWVARSPFGSEEGTWDPGRSRKMCQVPVEGPLPGHVLNSLVNRPGIQGILFPQTGAAIYACAFDTILKIIPGPSKWPFHLFVDLFTGLYWRSKRPLLTRHQKVTVPVYNLFFGQLWFHFCSCFCVVVVYMFHSTLFPSLSLSHSFSPLVAFVHVYTHHVIAFTDEKHVLAKCFLGKRNICIIP